MNRIFCKLCLAEDPKHAGFTAQKFEMMPDIVVVGIIEKLQKHLRIKHPEAFDGSLAAGLDLARFLHLCAFDFEEPFAIASRDKLRYDLAKLTRAYKLSDEKIEEKVFALDPACEWRESVIALIKSLRDQLEETGKYSQDEPAEPPLIVTP